MPRLTFIGNNVSRYPFPRPTKGLSLKDKSPTSFTTHIKFRNQSTGDTEDWTDTLINPKDDESEHSQNIQHWVMCMGIFLNSIYVKYLSYKLDMNSCYTYEVYLHTNIGLVLIRARLNVVFYYSEELHTWPFNQAGMSKQKPKSVSMTITRSVWLLYYWLECHTKSSPDPIWWFCKTNWASIACNWFATSC